MYLVVIGWLYVAGMAAVVEATSPNGSVLGGLVTFVFWGVLPLAIVLYLLRSPARRRARRAAAAEADAVTSAGLDPDERGHAPGDAVAPERKEP